MLEQFLLQPTSNNHSNPRVNPPLNGNRFRDPSFTSQRTTLKFLLNLIYENVSHWLHGRQYSMYADGERDPGMLESLSGGLCRESLVTAGLFPQLYICTVLSYKYIHRGR